MTKMPSAMPSSLPRTEPSSYPSSLPSQMPSNTPTSTPTDRPSSSFEPTTCRDEPDWYDAYGLGCDYYTAYQELCNWFDGYYKNFGKSAKQACCICNGGDHVSEIPTTLPSPSPSIFPSISTIPSISKSPSDAPSVCRDESGWIDSKGDGCDTYDENSYYCQLYNGQYKNFGKTANEACCICGGGDHKSAIAIGVPSGSPSVSVPPTASPKPTDIATVCRDDPGWTDSFYDGCDVFDSKPYFCNWYAGAYINFGKSCSEACCICGGGDHIPELTNAPSQSPSVGPTPL